MKRYKIGDKVWVASFGKKEKTIPCPVCFTKKEVTLILGNGERIILPCEYCGHGFNSPTGYITEYGFVADAKLEIIDKINIEQYEESEKIEYQSSHYILHPENIFDTKEEALEYSKKKNEERQKAEFTRTEYIKKDRQKSFAWNAGYHLREAKKLEKDIQYHKEKARIFKEKAKIVDGQG